MRPLWSTGSHGIVTWGLHQLPVKHLTCLPDEHALVHDERSCVHNDAHYKHATCIACLYKNILALPHRVPMVGCGSCAVTLSRWCPCNCKHMASTKSADNLGLAFCRTGDFWIQCDFCDTWYDGKCVQVRLLCHSWVCQTRCCGL